MSRIAFSKLARVTRQVRSSTTTSSTAARSYSTHQFTSRSFVQVPRAVSASTYRCFSTTGAAYKGLIPETDDPKPKETQQHTPAAKPSDLTTTQYNELSDQFMELIQASLEELAEKREDVDLEYSAGVMTLNFPPTGTYVINKQPPNKQIWLSSPLSGPKRYDFVISSEGQDAKEGTGAGDWVYLRDGTSMRSLLLKELEVDLDSSAESYTSKQALTDE